MNRFTHLLDIDEIKAAISKAETSENQDDKYIILLGHYSINIQSHYKDGEECDNDWNDFEEAIGASMEVNDYDDLVIDLTESED